MTLRGRYLDHLSWEERCELILKHTHSQKDSKFKQWLRSREYLGGIYCDSIMHKYCYEVWRKINKQNNDHFMVMSGNEGTGKSTIAMIFASIVDKSFNVEDRVCYTMKQYVEKVQKAEKGQAFVLDEGNMFLYSREAMKSHNTDIIKLFTIIRQKNLLTIICVPNFFTLDSYVRKHRIDGLLYAHEKGKYFCFIKKAVKIIAEKGKNSHMVHGHKIPPGTKWPGYWNKVLPPQVNWALYSSHKSAHYKDFMQELDKRYVKEEKVS